MRTLTLLALPVLVLAGCSDDGDASAASTGSSGSATPTSVGADDDGVGSMGTTAAASESDGGGTTTQAGDTTGAADSGTTAADSATQGSTGPQCDPGTVDCSCDRGACEDDLQCLGDVCLPPGSCEKHPEGEPNDDEATAVALGEVPGCMVAEVAGAVDADDADWFSYHGTNAAACGQDTLGIIDAESDLEVCMYWECDQGNEQVVCFGMPEATSPDGWPGCCGPASNVVFMQRQCLGVGDGDGTIYLEVRGPQAATCVDYNLAYLF